MLILSLLLLSSSFVMWCQCFARINDLCSWVDFRNEESVICWSVTGQNLWQQRWRIPVLKPTRVTHILTKYWIRLGGSICCGGWTLNTTNTAVGSTWDSIKGMSISLVSGGVLSKWTMITARLILSLYRHAASSVQNSNVQCCYSRYSGHIYITLNASVALWRMLWSTARRYSLPGVCRTRYVVTSGVCSSHGHGSVRLITRTVTD